MRFTRDLWSAYRTWRRAGSLPVVVVLMLGVAIGAATAIFSIAHAVLLRPLPVTDPDRLVVLWGRDDGRSQSVVEVSLTDLRAWRAGQSSFTTIEVFGSVNWGTRRITAPGEPFSATQNGVSTGFFDVLGVRPILGRTFRPGDGLAGTPGTVILSADLWRRRFSSDPSIVGKILRFGDGPDAKPFEVIGVMNPDFRIPAGAEIWFPAEPDLSEAQNVRVFYAVGRLKEGVSLNQAVAELSTIARREEIKRGQSDSAMMVVATPLLAHLLGPVKPALLAIAGAAAMLLLIACANAAGLLVVHGVARRREVAVRLALGARRWQLARQFLIESAVLAAGAAVLGMAVAFLGFNAIVRLAPIEVPRLNDAAIDTGALLFAVAVSALTALALGLLPAWQCTGGELLAGLHQQSRGGTAAPHAARIRRLLVSAQVAAAVVLLTAAAFFARSFVSLIRLDLGFDPDHVLTFEIDVPPQRYPAGPKQWTLVESVIDQLSHVPGVKSVGAIYQRPFANGPIGMDTHVALEGQPLTPQGTSHNPILNWEVATPGYFAAMDIRLLKGRLFEARDVENRPPVVVLSESAATRLWPGQEPIGKRMLVDGLPADGKIPIWQTVIGVVEDARYREIQVPRYDLYLPYRQAPNPVQYYMVRGVSDPTPMTPAVSAAVARVDSEARLENVSTMDEIVGRTIAPWRFSTIVVTTLSAMALAFAAIGLAALVAYAVTQRTREIGVRVALGARAGHIVRLVVREGAWSTGAGLAVGILCAWMMARSISSLLFGVSANDSVTFVGVAAMFACVSLIAAYLPARRATSIEPVLALRNE